MFDLPTVSAGVHSNTKEYIDPSNKDWIKPRQSTLESDRKKKTLKLFRAFIKTVIYRKHVMDHKETTLFLYKDLFFIRTLRLRLIKI